MQLGVYVDNPVEVLFFYAFFGKCLFEHCENYI